MKPSLNLKHQLDTKATLACCIAVIFWAAGPVGITLLTKYLDSFTQNALRYCVASLFWLPFLAHSIRKNKCTPKIWKYALWPAFFNAVGQSFWAATLYYLDPALASLILESSVIVVATFSIIVFPDERNLIKSPAFIIGFSLALIGVTGIIIFKPGFAQSRSIVGFILALCSSLTWAAYTLSIKIKMRNIDSRSAFAVISLYTVIPLALLAFIFGKPAIALHIPLIAWLIIIVSAIFAMALSHVLYYSAIKRIGATIPAIALLAIPFVVLAASYFLFSEKLNTPQCLFGLTLIAGAATAIFAQNKTKT